MFSEELKLVPHLPGSYQMYNSENIIIYVGKAKDLNKRLHSYFRGTCTGKTALMVSEVAYFKYIVTKTEKESFILELNLIKKYDPKYNIMLRDDKTYPYIEYISSPYPTLKVSRYTEIKRKDKKQLFGPYPNAYAARRIVNLINRLYPLKKCEGKKDKVCLYYHIGECLGYCTKCVNDEKIKEMENEILSFLKGNDKVLIDKIMNKINELSVNLNFEKALELKNELDFINIVLDKQKVELHDYVNRDIISTYYQNGYLSIQIFFLRNGKLLGGHQDIINVISSEEEELNSYIYSFYQKHEIPREILIDENINREVLESLLETKIINPQKGIKKDLIKMCHDNAKLNLEREIDMFINNENRTFKANDRLREILELQSLKTIESFDNSNLFGAFSVSAMVVFKNGKASKKDYRKFKISVDKNDDYHMMKEVIYRRYFRCLTESIELPDLIVLDGGENQLNAAKESLNELNLSIPLCGLKKDDHHRTKVLIDLNGNEIDLTNESDVFNLLTRIQDEVHRFVITYHREIRSRGTLASKLDNIPGIGEKRRKDLIKKFGSLTKIKEASYDELKEIIPENLIETLQSYLKEL